MDVKIKKLSGCGLVILAVFTLGVAPVAQWLIEKAWPKRVDDEGLETRGGKRIAWREFTKAVQVHTHVTKGSSATVAHFELHSPKGKVIVAPYRLENGEKIWDYIWQRLPTSAKTN